MVSISFQPRPGSHPFIDRECAVIPNEQIKVGRAVAKAKPSPNNFIFDCKVLSRNHALVWLSDGDFFIKDTKSSNGTFVNSLQLSRSGEESGAVQLRDGDVVQFGVDVMENPSRTVTQRCIIATFHCRGQAEKSDCTSLPKDLTVDVSLQDLSDLAQVLTDTRQRQEVLEGRLGLIQNNITDSKVETRQSFKNFLEEDELLARVESLENQLDVYTMDLTEEDMEKRFDFLETEQHLFSEKSQRILRRVVMEKVDLERQVADMKRDYRICQEEGQRLNTLYQESQQEMGLLAEKHRQRLGEMENLRAQLAGTDERHAALDKKAVEERHRVEVQIQEFEQERLQLLSEHDILSGQLSELKINSSHLQQDHAHLNEKLQQHSLLYQSKLKAVDRSSKEKPDDRQVQTIEGMLIHTRDTAENIRETCQHLNAQILEFRQIADHHRSTVGSLQRDLSDKSDIVLKLEESLKEQPTSKADTNLIQASSILLESDFSLATSTRSVPQRQNLDACKHLIARLQRENQGIEESHQNRWHEHQLEKAQWLDEQRTLHQQVVSASEVRRHMQNELESVNVEIEVTRRSLHQREEEFKEQSRFLPVVTMHSKEVNVRTWLLSMLVVGLISFILSWWTAC